VFHITETGNMTVSPVFLNYYHIFYCMTAWWINELLHCLFETDSHFTQTRQCMFLQLLTLQYRLYQQTNAKQANIILLIPFTDNNQLHPNTAVHFHTEKLAFERTW